MRKKRRTPRLLVAALFLSVPLCLLALQEDLLAQSWDLNVSISPGGGGSVSGTGINCPGDCTESFDCPNYDCPSVTLTASPAAGYQFSSWSGDASGSNPTIIVSGE